MASRCAASPANVADIFDGAVSGTRAPARVSISTKCSQEPRLPCCAHAHLVAPGLRARASRRRLGSRAESAPISRTRPDAASSALDGTQPRFTHVPPTCARCASRRSTAGPVLAVVRSVASRVVRPSGSIDRARNATRPPAAAAAPPRASESLPARRSRVAARQHGGRKALRPRVERGAVAADAAPDNHDVVVVVVHRQLRRGAASRAAVDAPRRCQG